MKRQEFIKCVRLAQSEGFTPLSYFGTELAVFQGCALDDKRRIVSMIQVASMIFAHCATFAGTWDHSELENLEELSKRWDLI